MNDNIDQMGMSVTSEKLLWYLHMQKEHIVYFLKRYKDVKKIIYSHPATVVILKNNCKGVSKITLGDVWDYEKGFLYAYIKALKSPVARIKIENMEFVVRRASFNLGEFGICCKK